MHKDIRSYFQVKKVQKPPMIIDDEGDDVIPESPDVQRNNKKKSSRKKRVISDSDEEIFDVKNKESKIDSNKASHSKTKRKAGEKPSLKEVNSTNLFGSDPIKRTEPLIKKVKKNTETGIHSDEEFEKSLLEVDEVTEAAKNIKAEIKAVQSDKGDCKEIIIHIKQEKSPLKSGIESRSKVIKNESPVKINGDSKNRGGQNEKNDTYEDAKGGRLNAISNVFGKKNQKRKELNTSTESSYIKREESKKDDDKKKFNGFVNKNRVDESNAKMENSKRNFSEFIEGDKSTSEEHDVGTPKNKKKKLDKTLNESVLTDEERHERKMQSAALYQKYLNRSGPKHLGAKEIPQGTPDCLKNCAFLITGVLESFDREDVTDAIAKYGGTVKNGISKKVTHVIAGEDAGPAKTAKAQELGIPILNEDQFLKLIIDTSNNKSNKSEQRVEKKGRSPSKHKPKDSLNESKHKSSKGKMVGSVKEDDSALNGDRSKSRENRDTKPKTPKKINHEPIIRITHSELEEGTRKTKLEVNAIQSASTTAPDKSNSLMWVDKYKPQTLKQVIGQHGDASNAKKLANWLTKWYVNRKAKLPKPSPWAKNDDGGYFKAALLSGPPGVGKTTTVSLVCKELGFDTVEFNASDTRSKNLIKEQISELLTTTSLAGYAKGVTGKQAVTKKHVLVMDEVDGMAGNEDRGGLQELIALIKSASVPIICMCNDRNSQKMRSLVNYCYDLRFSRPRVEQIKGAMMSICCKEGIRIPPDALTQLIVAANQDLRQILNMLSMWAVDPDLTNADQLKKDANSGKKDLKLGPWEAIRKVFSAEEHKTMSINDKSDLFFYDYSLAPLFVQENYLQVVPHCPKHELLERISMAADSISAGDLVDARIRSRQAWNLLPSQAMLSSVIPGHVLSGHVAGQIQFPAWLGKNSRATKMRRLCQEIHAHTRLSTSGSKSSIYLDYSSHLRDAVLAPLLRDKADGVAESLEVLEAYHLLREDLDSLTELSLWPGQRNPLVLVDAKVKAAMTRTYNKKALALPYAPGNVRKGRARDDNAEGEEGLDDDDHIDDEDSDPENDALIKKKKVDKSNTSKEKGSSSKERSNKEKASSSKDRPSSSKSKSSSSKDKPSSSRSKNK